MTIDTLIGEALVGKYIKDCQCLYYITEAEGCTVAGIKIDTELMIPIDMEWFDDVSNISFDAEILTKEEFIGELKQALNEIKTKITDEFIKK